MKQSKIWDYPPGLIWQGFEETGLQSNYRVCRDTLKVIHYCSVSNIFLFGQIQNTVNKNPTN